MKEKIMNHLLEELCYYNLLEYKNSTAEELQLELIDLKEELEDYDFDSQEEYEERLDDLDDDIYYLKLDIKLIEKYLNEKKQG